MSRCSPGGPTGSSSRPRPSPRRCIRPSIRSNVNTLEHLAAKTLELNAIGVVNLATDRPIVFEPYAENRDLGAFIVIDKLTNATVAAGHAALLTAPQPEHPLAGARYQPRGAGRPQESEARGALVHGPLGRRQIDDRQSGREEAAPHEPAHVSARRRQRSARFEQGSGIHPGRPRREHPQGRRGREAHDRRRAHRDHGFHLTVPSRAADGAQI